MQGSDEFKKLQQPDVTPTHGDYSDVNSLVDPIDDLPF